MSKDEFEKLLDKEVSVPYNDYPVIECVYLYHPSISQDSVKGKAQVAMLYTNFGIRLIRDMLPVALKVRELSEELLTHQRIVDDLKKTLDLINLGKGMEGVDDLIP